MVFMLIKNHKNAHNYVLGRDKKKQELQIERVIQNFTVQCIINIMFVFKQPQTKSMKLALCVRLYFLHLLEINHY